MSTSSLKKTASLLMLSTCLTPAITQAETSINITTASDFTTNPGNYQTGNTLILQNNIDVNKLTGWLPNGLENFTLDGQDKTISTTNQDQTATSRMIFQNSNNITLKNITFDGFFRMQDGIFKFTNTKNISLENFTISNMVTIDAKRTEHFWGNAIGFKDGSTGSIDNLSVNNVNFETTSTDADGAEGGVVYIQHAYPGSAASSVNHIKNSTFSGNNISAPNTCLRGGIVHAAGTLPKISNTRFDNNTIKAQEVNGGVTYNSSANALTLENVSYNNNNVISSSNDIKGGLNYNRGQETFNTVEFKENTVTAQTGNIHGGVIYNEFEGSNTNNVTFDSVEISDNTIEATAGEISGGLISNQGSQSTVSKLSGNFDNNQITAGTNATGGLVYNDGTLSEISSARFDNNTLDAQKVNGGLVYNNGTLSEISNTQFDNNTINAQEVNGGVIYNNSSTPLTITNATFSNNTANTVQGGAIYNNNSTLTLINSNFSGNGATTGNSSGGAIYNFGTNAQLNITADGTDSVFQNNSAAHGEAIYSKDGTVTLTANNQNNVTFYDTIEGDNYVLNINGDGSGKTAQVDNPTPDAPNQNVGEVQFFADVSGAETLNLNDGGIMHLGKNVTVNVENYNGNGGLLKLDVELDEEARTMQNGVINVTEDVTGNTDVIINSLNPEGFELATNKFLSADNDNQDTASDFRIAAVYGSPYEWKTIKNKQGDIGSQWYMMLTAYYQPEVTAYVGLERAAIEQNRGLVDSVEKGLAFKGNRICTGEGCIEDSLLPRPEAWVHASYENASIEAPSEFDADIQGLTAGVDLMRDYDQRMGAFASHNIGNYDFNGKGDHPSHYSSDVDIKSYTGGLYYQLKRNNLRALATVFAGTQDIDVDAKSSYTNGSTNAMQYGASAEIAHKFAYRNHLNLEPSLGLYYTALDIDELHDNMGKTVEFNMLHYLEAELGLKVEYQFCRGTCANYVYVKPSMIKTFANGAKTKITDLLNAKSYDDELLGRMEVGSNFGLTNHFSGYVTGGYTFGDDYNAYDLNIGIRYAF